jgi:hypothetical protein
MTTTSETRSNGQQPSVSAGPVTVIVGEIIHNPESPALQRTNGKNADHGTDVSLSLVRRRLWWRRDRLITVRERPRDVGPQEAE